MLKGPRMVDVEFFGNFSCSCKRISFGDPLNWSLSTSYGWPLCSSSSRLLSPLQNFLNHHRTVCSLANVLLVLEVVFTVLPPIFNSNKKISWICFLYNIISLVWNKYKINWTLASLPWHRPPMGSWDPPSGKRLPECSLFCWGWRAGGCTLDLELVNRGLGWGVSVLQFPPQQLNVFNTWKLRGLPWWLRQ